MAGDAVEVAGVVVGGGAAGKFEWLELGPVEVEDVLGDGLAGAELAQEGGGGALELPGQVVNLEAALADLLGGRGWVGE